MKKIIFRILVVGVIFWGLFLILANRKPLKKSNTVTVVTPTSIVSTESATHQSQQNVGDQPDIPFKLSSGFKIGVFSTDTLNARDLQFSPDGILLASLPSEGKVVALPDKDNDGRADEVHTVVSDLNNPHGLAFYNGKLFIAEETRIARYSWDAKSQSASEEKELFKLPTGGRHSTRTVEFNKKGDMFVSIGSTCDACNEKDPWISTIIVSNSDGQNPRVYAKGLRNSVFIKVNPFTDQLWGTEMGRDYLGDNTPPDEINILQNGLDYGWPVCYGKNVHDSSFDKKKYGSLTEKSICSSLYKQPSLYDIQAHSAPLGLTFITSKQFPSDWQGDLLVAYHGSWNRSVPTGYKVVHMKVRDIKIVGEEDFISGFEDGSNTLGRPVDVEFDKNGSLFVSDDKDGAIYKVIYNK